MWDTPLECESEFGSGDGGAEVDVTGAGNLSYLWDTGETTKSVSDLHTGWHFVRVTYIPN